MQTLTFMLLGFMVLVPSYIVGKENQRLGIFYLFIGMLFLATI